VTQLRIPRVIAAVSAVAAAALVLSGCSGPAPKNAPGAEPSGNQTLQVYAAASLTDSFTQLGKGFESAHPGVKVSFDFDGSSTLVTQLAQGAPADVFASADEQNMRNAVDQNLIARHPIDFATNTLEIATPPGNPAHIASFADLAKPGIKTVVCADGVPCGTAVRQMEKNTGITIAALSEEQSVTNVLAKVESGDADAGVVYVTDVKAAGSKVDGVAFPESARVVNSYPIAVTAGSRHAKLAEQFIRYVTGAKGRKTLAAAGFGAPAK
jgi:molybdate transport system substrate-binding protein